MPGVIAPAVSGRKNRHHAVRTGHGLGIDHHDPRMQIPIPHGLRRAVRIPRPEMMIIHLAAVDILPPRVKQPPVRQRPRRVVLLVVARQRTQVAPVRVAAIQNRHLRQPAVHPPFAASGHEHDAPVRQIGRLDIVKRSVRQLAQPGAVDADFVEVVVLGAAPAVAEQNLPSVIMHLRIAHAAARIVDQRRRRARAHRPAHQPPALAPCLAVRVVRVVTDVRIPVPVRFVGFAQREHQFVDPRHRSARRAKRGQQLRRRARCGRRPDHPRHADPPQGPPPSDPPEKISARGRVHRESR